MKTKLAIISCITLGLLTAAYAGCYWPDTKVCASIGDSGTIDSPTQGGPTTGKCDSEASTDYYTSTKPDPDESGHIPSGYERLILGGATCPHFDCEWTFNGSRQTGTCHFDPDKTQDKVDTGSTQCNG